MLKFRQHVTKPSKSTYNLNHLHVINLQLYSILKSDWSGTFYYW